MDTEEAIDRGVKFLEEKAGYYAYKLISVELEESVWVVRFNVGAFIDEIVELQIDDGTERIIKYERPE